MHLSVVQSGTTFMSFYASKNNLQTSWPLQQLYWLNDLTDFTSFLTKSEFSLTKGLKEKNKLPSRKIVLSDWNVSGWVNLAKL